MASQQAKPSSEQTPKHLSLSSLSSSPKMASEQSKPSSEQTQLDPPVLNLSKYSKRVILETILDRTDGGSGLVGGRVVIGGWVKSSKEVRKAPVVVPPPPQAAEGAPPPAVAAGSTDLTCVEVFQSRIPFFRSLLKVLGGGGGVQQNPIREKLESVIQRPPPPPPPSVSILQVSDGSCVASLQVLVDSSIAPPIKILHTGTCILAEGVLQQPSIQGKHVVELKVEKILHLGIVDQEKYPLSKKRLPLDMLRDCSHFRARTTTVASVMRIRNALTQGSHRFFQNQGSLCVEVPIITTTDCEGHSEKFFISTLSGKPTKRHESKNPMDDTEGISLDVVKNSIKEKSKQVEELKRSESNKESLVLALQDLRKANELALQVEAKEKLKAKKSPRTDKVDCFEDAFLTVSGRLHLESYACALGNVYSFGPRFREEKSESKKSLAEMWMVELEMAFSELEDAMNCADDLLKFLSKWVLENCSEDLKFVSKRIDKTIVDRLQLVALSSFAKISYAEAVEVLKQVTNKIFETKIELGVSLTEEHETYLAEEIYKRPVLIYNFPKELKPFYVRVNDDGRTVAAFDLIVPKVGTLIRGSQNEERINALSSRIKEMGLQREQYEWYLDLRRNGTVKHSGFSFVFDLMVLYATGLSDVKDAIPFPRICGKANN